MTARDRKQRIFTADEARHMSAEMCQAGAFVLVFDSAGGRGAAGEIRDMGGGWRVAVEAWQHRPDMPYLILMAEDRRRIVARSPLVILCADLTEGLAVACEKLDDVQCAWMLFLAPEARAVAERVLLSEAVPEGQA